jgi:signal transduction histidine kinase/CheY-like chemotaxis protein
LIPLYSGIEIIGLLQLNDKRPEMLSLETIGFLEKTGNMIGMAFKRIQNENKIKENEQSLIKQNADYFILNKEYSSLNVELTKGLNLIQDINDELNISKEKAEESDHLKSAFLANMSHEIRTPMNAIVGFSNFLLEPGLSKEKVEDYVQIINASCQQLLSVISDIIDISKIETGQISIDLEMVDINNLLDELFTTYKEIVEAKQLSLHYTCDRTVGHIQLNTDGNRIKQIICNLLNNAIKFTYAGEIEFGYNVKENFIELYVKDSGIGIAPENHALIFQRFNQIEPADKKIYGGNGLGLSISKVLVEKLGGTIIVNSELGIGSTFIFTLPHQKEEEKNVSPASKARPDQLINWKEKTILIVEDEKNNHAYIKELLSSTEVAVLDAWDGEEAVEQAKNHTEISLVLMDIKMPKMDGYEATRLIKKNRPILPVIAQTAYSLSQDRKKALEAGCDNYISKPINKDRFIEVLTSYLL